ncbi:MAG: formylglycine-generating enzyme family protein [Cyclobacteriaceae bacterium]|nr:formylglycine-generating enzyme family protein [Cyclobacteriaceae bacterium HetDA_MAG_MS6]
MLPFSVILPDLRKSTYILFATIVCYACDTSKSARETDADTKNTATEILEGMVLIPGGTFTMGGRSEQAYQDEFPRHDVEVSPFYLDATEITNTQFTKFVEETGYLTVAERPVDWDEISKQLPANTPKPPDSVLMPGSLVFKPTEGPVDLRDFSQWWVWKTGADWRHPEGPQSDISGREDHPVVHIALEDAQAYATWAGKRLPTEAELEWAATGGDNDNKYPWGNEPIEQAYDKANFWQGFFPYQNLEEDGFYATAPVKNYPPNAYGLYDMAGNVWEWCADRYHVQSYEQDSQVGVVKNPEGSVVSYDPNEPYAKEKFVVRGGSFLCNDSYCSGYRVARRMPSDRDSGANHKGFRCAKDI